MGEHSPDQKSEGQRRGRHHEEIGSTRGLAEEYFGIIRNITRGSSTQKADASYQ